MAKSEVTGSVRERLLEAADELFYGDGVHTVGIDRVLAQAGVAKASLYSTFGSKDGLVRAYLGGRDARLRARIEKRLASTDGAVARVLSLFDGLHERVRAGGYRGCPFIAASAEGPAGTNAAREASVVHRTWRRELFTRLADDAGVDDAAEMGRALAMLYDGAAIAAGLEGDTKAPLTARRAAERLMASAMPKGRRS